MVAHNRGNSTRLDIIRVASSRFFVEGYSKTTVRSVASELGISPGHLMFYFPTKEHLLAEVVDMLCDFQWKIIKRKTDDGESQLMAICFELTTMAAACEESEIARDFYISAYTHPLTLEIIRKNDSRRAREIFGQYCQHWTDTQYLEAETLISGIEYSTMMTTESSSPLDIRISGALNALLAIYGVPEEVRRNKINKTLSMDYREMGKQILREFIDYVSKTTEQAYEDFILQRSKI